jgi:hypothetical protein
MQAEKWVTSNSRPKKYSGTLWSKYFKQEHGKKSVGRPKKERYDTALINY